MSFLPGQAIPLGEPGAFAGYFTVISPSLDKVHVRAAKLHPAVIAASTNAGGSFDVKNGTLIGKDKNDSGLFRFKVVDFAAASPSVDYRVRPADVVGGIYPAFASTISPDTFASGSVSIVDAPMVEGKTDQVLAAYSAPAVNDLLYAGTGGTLTATDPGGAKVVGKVTAFDLSVVSAPGGTPVTVLTVRYKGSDSF